MPMRFSSAASSSAALRQSSRCSAAWRWKESATGLSAHRGSGHGFAGQGYCGRRHTISPYDDCVQVKSIRRGRREKVTSGFSDDLRATPAGDRRDEQHRAEQAGPCRTDGRFSQPVVGRAESEAPRSLARLAVRARPSGGSRSLGRDAFCSGSRSSRTIISSDLWTRIRFL